MFYFFQAVKGLSFTISFPRVINFKLPLKNHNMTQHEELGFSWLTQMKVDYVTNLTT